MLLYPFKIIYSGEARRKMRRILELFKPDVVHLNNFNYQLTPSILYEIKKHNIPTLYTAHDYQLLCPNNLMFKPNKGVPCEECVNSGFTRCIRNNCIHGSKLRSVLGCMESTLYHRLKTYSLIDKVICPSEFIEKKLTVNPIFLGKTAMIHNFIQKTERSGEVKKGNYVLYFGRFSIEKGLGTLINVCKRLPEISFIFAGGGPLKYLINDIPNIKYAGFLRGDELKKTIAEARFSICPSEWYENYPFSVIESLIYGTPVIGANIGGIPEIIKNENNGLLFQPFSENDLFEKVSKLWNNNDLLEEMTQNCFNTEFETPDSYGEKLFKLYQRLMNGKGSSTYL